MYSKSKLPDTSIIIQGVSVLILLYRVSLTDSGQVHVGIVEDEQVHGHATVHTLLSEIVIQGVLRDEDSLFLVGTEHLTVVPVGQFPWGVEYGQRGVEYQELACETSSIE